ncbi:hypothetical protein N7532_001044 [Penicillium argentinense]|uniref:Uncharacterized protein n=1 Tax=Penicillium argentinense TaxID=1131581 RepID=A0A9W9G1R2_9EURO|nr:uncharacterized protein N7532_001044 [Penicillium argentinense]KAJ5110509.1 hypothetical protein N7532_001044 [Penicillium argentinense]
MSIPDNETAKNTFPGETDQQKKQSYVSWIKDFYNTQYESWMPWIEDQYLRWFGRGDNKASYATKGELRLFIRTLASINLDYGG